MSKKILGAANVMLFMFYLSVTSNIVESVPETNTQVAETVQTENLVFDPNDTRAGVFSTISAYSFTTESDEETGIEKKNVILVTSSYEMNNESTADSENVENNETEEILKESEEATEPVYENRWGISLTEEEIDLLARIVWLESSGEPVEGQEAVVEVIFNRMASDLYPDTLYDVLSQGNPVQFCSWKNRDIAEPTQKEYDSIYNVLNGNTDLLRNDTLYFSTTKLTSNVDVKICCHYFCY